MDLFLISLVHVGFNQIQKRSCSIVYKRFLESWSPVAGIRSSVSSVPVPVVPPTPTNITVPSSSKLVPSKTADTSGYT